ncbi:MAG: hypothetical protein A3I75_06970 [Deltaproteobacteria bacterium RIFCSPLOWO2_02_FULL_50_16]|nr:MAG: hypothetical protein A3I75_06970 [Deltaproteobacteria bacterium RIFCSPLOWO2_02_FULL_50_16]
MSLARLWSVLGARKVIVSLPVPLGSELLALVAVTSALVTEGTTGVVVAGAGVKVARHSSIVFHWPEILT